MFRERLSKIADQIPGTGTTRKNLINYLVGTWKIEPGVGGRKYKIASTHFIDHIGKPLSVKVPYCLTVRQWTSRSGLLWLVQCTITPYLAWTIQSVGAVPCAALIGKFHLHLGLDNFKREHLSDWRSADGTES